MNIFLARSTLDISIFPLPYTHTQLTLYLSYNFLSKNQFLHLSFSWLNCLHSYRLQIVSSIHLQWKCVVLVLNSPSREIVGGNFTSAPFFFSFKLVLFLMSFISFWICYHPHLIDSLGIEISFLFEKFY